jgi:hypothetical protein
MAERSSSRRLPVVTTADTPIGDLYGPPEELADYVDALRERGEPVPEKFLELLDMWRANNDLPPYPR